MENWLSLESQRIVLLGACGVLGRSHVKTLKELGASLYIADKPGSGVKEIAEYYGIEGIESDCLKEDDIKRVVKTAQDELGEIDAAIYNSAITSEGLSQASKDPFPSFVDYPLELWNRTIAVNLTGAFVFAREVGRVFEKQGYGNLVLVSSIYGNVAPDHRIYADESFNTFPGYSASKAGVIGLMKWLATLWGSKNIRVNSLSPGGVFNEQPRDFVKKYSQRTPLNRMAEPHEISSMLAYLVSPSSSYCTGQDYVVDGGIMAW